MSWLVKNLILNSSDIRSVGDLDSDDYMSLLILEKKIKTLKEKGILSEDDVKLLVLISNYKSYTQVAEEIGITRQIVSSRFERISQKLAYYLGNYYTDLGYATYISSKYNLPIDKVNKLMKFILED
jgi:biotin operon repressor